MKAVSLWQPWASAIPLGLKRIETRGWSTRYRGPLAIHAAKKADATVRAAAIRSDVEFARLPFGAIIATCVLYDVYDLDLLGQFVTPLERSWGDYSPGRFGWYLTDIKAINPIPYRGGQGLFNVPDDML